MKRQSSLRWTESCMYTLDKEKIKAVFFDYDNTLGNRYLSSYNTYKELITEYRPDLLEDPLLVEALLQDMTTYDQFGNVATDYVLKRVQGKYGITFDLKDPYRWWNDTHCKNAVLWEDTMPTLEKLKEKYKLGIITNGDAYGQSTKIRITKLDIIVDDFVVSGEIGIHKPDKRIFETACRRLDVKTEESVYVGDTFGNDILGAVRAGMIPIWIWPDQVREMHTEIIRIQKFSDLLDIL